MHQQKTVDLMLKMDTKLTLIPLIFIFLRIWSTIRFVLYLCHSQAVSNIVLMCLHVSKYYFEQAINSDFLTKNQTADDFLHVHTFKSCFHCLWEIVCLIFFRV